jgi:hypothetical protein
MAHLQTNVQMLKYGLYWGDPTHFQKWMEAHFQSVKNYLARIRHLLLMPNISATNLIGQTSQ